MASNNGITSMGHDIEPTATLKSQYQSTLAIHGDDHLNRSTDVSPALHVSTTFRYTSNPSELVPAKDLEGPLPLDAHIYSRETAPNTTRFEAILSQLLSAPCLSYSSGLAAVHAFYVFLNPKRVSIGDGYHGCHGVLDLHIKITGAKQLPLDCAEEDLQKGDVIHLETPVNPTGEAFEMKKYAEKAHRKGAYLLVDATFGPPGLQDPFAWGADVVMHSGTKYLGGHSDLLCGVLATKHEGWIEGLKEERTYLGSVMGNLEGWLGVRSLRTLEVRVSRQSENCEQLVKWLDEMVKAKQTNAIRSVVEKVHHASLQIDDLHWLKKQMPNGFGPVFAITMKSEELAKRLPSQLGLFHHATSLGGVESLIEWRAMSDRTVDTKLVRTASGPVDEDTLASLQAKMSANVHITPQFAVLVLKEVKSSVPNQQSDSTMQAPMGPNRHQHAIYPPVVTDLQVIDYVNDRNGLDYSRDIGRSFTLNGKNFYIFGDTFCQNTAGDFVGLVDNTAALLPQKNKFCDSRYLEFNCDDTVKALVPLTTAEMELQKSTGGRITLWGFGGVVELLDGTGRIWFERGIDHGDGNNEYCGIGIAEIRYVEHCERLITKRFDELWPSGLIFGANEPKVGSLSTIVEGEYVYLYSEYMGNTILARAWSPMTTSRNLYRFWDGKDYVEDYNAAVPIPAFQDIPQGAVVRSHLFGRKKNYIFVGVDKWADSKIQVGAAETLEGSWEVWPVALTQGIKIKDGFRYCIYPHLFASHTRKRELLVTWSEQYPGGVIAGKLQFQTTEEECEEECELND